MSNKNPRNITVSDREDRYWSREGDKRLRGFKRNKAFSHDKIKIRIKLDR